MDARFLSFPKRADLCVAVLRAKDPREYVHRVGRAARLGEIGQVHARLSLSKDRACVSDEMRCGSIGNERTRARSSRVRRSDACNHSDSSAAQGVEFTRSAL
eukprot:982977-Pleurochrysis_carterae.AAC.1